MNRDDLELEIRQRAGDSAEVKQGLEAFGKQVVEVWRSYSPVRSGRYAASVRVLKRFRSNGLPGVKVGATSKRAHFIEYGTGADDKGESPRYVPALGVQVSKDTPTPAFAPRAKTAAHFGGDETPAPKDSDSADPVVEDEQ